MIFRTCAIAIILSLYLAKFNMPIPVWTRKKSCHVIRYPFHQVFAVSIVLGGLFYNITVPWWHKARKIILTCKLIMLTCCLVCILYV